MGAEKLHGETNTISAGQTFTNAAISTVGEIDVFTFDGASNETVWILMAKTGGTGSNPFFYLKAPDGTIVASADYSATVATKYAYKLTQTGTYQILCQDNAGNETFTYNLTLITSPGPNAADEDASEILAGQTLTNRSIGVPGDIDVYTFSGTSNQTVSILMAKTGGMGSNPYFYLEAPDGTLAARADYEATVATKYAYRLTQTGTYQILCMNNVGTATFTYNLTLITSPGPNAADEDASEIPAGQTLTNRSIGVPADIDVYTFSGTSNQTVSILMAKTGGTGSNPYFYLEAPDGTIAASADYNATVATKYAYKLTQIGTYQILCKNTVGTATFTYNLTLITSPGPNAADEDASEILAGQTLTNRSIGVPADIDVYTFSGTSNQTVSILMAKTGGTGSNPYFYLEAPDGTIAAGASYNAAVASEYAYMLTQTGTYQILCKNTIGTATFTYNLTLIKNPGPNAVDPGDAGPTIEPGQTLTNSIGFPGDLDALSFHAIAGDTIELAIVKTGGSGTYPHLQLQAPDGTVLANAAGPASATISLSCLGQTGNYMAICNDDGGSETFSYTLSLTQTPIEPPSSGAAPYLTWYRCADNNLHLRWSTAATGFSLHTATNLFSPVWVPATNVAYTIADHFYVDLGIPTNRSAFYRLICTNGACGL